MNGITPFTHSNPSQTMYPCYIPKYNIFRSKTFFAWLIDWSTSNHVVKLYKPREVILNVHQKRSSTTIPFFTKHSFLLLYTLSTKVKDKCSNPFLSVLKNSCCSMIFSRINYVSVYVFTYLKCVQCRMLRWGFYHLLDYFLWHVSDRCYLQNVTQYTYQLVVLWTWV